MKPRQTTHRRLLFALSLGVSAALALGSMTERAEAGLVMTVGDSSASAGGTGTFDITLSAGANESFDISGYAIHLMVASASGVKFTNVEMAPNYIFGTNGAGLNVVPTPPFVETDFRADDQYFGNNPTGAIDFVGPITAGLLRVTYTVAAGTRGPVTVSLVTTSNDDTRISDADNNYIDFTAQDGQITIGGVPAVPEPSSLIAMATAAALLPIPTLVRRMRRKNG